MPSPTAGSFMLPAPFDNAVPNWVRTVCDGLVDLVYPPRCLGCSARPESAALPLCPRCLQGLERAPLMAVARRLDRLPTSHRALDGALALWVFDKGGTLQAVQHALKYGDRPRYGLPLGRLVGTAYGDDFPLPDGVIPIPLHRTRELERGYNQSAMLAEGVGEALGVPVDAGLLHRPRPTRSQTHLSRRARWQNVSGAFTAPGAAALRDRTWLLVDDVLTTGATAAAAAHTLKEAGAGAVFLATLAMART